jgi:vanillate O-demethylase monooxygenase subunit
LPPFARHQWYLAAWSDEVGRQPLERTILGELLVLYRTEAGPAVALTGLCPHRWMPLAKGRLRGDTLECAYHGMVFDADGQCRRAPGGRQAVSRNAQLRALPLVEDGPCLWIWPGDPARANAAAIPDIARAGLTGDDWHVELEPPIRIPARAQLLLDNLFDQSHIALVHPGSLGGNPLPEPGDLVVEETPNWFRVSHDLPVKAADASVRLAFPSAGRFIRSRVHSELLGVSLVKSVGSQTFNATADGDFLEALGCVNFLHFITPETPRSTHYFAAASRDFARDDPALSAVFKARSSDVLREDIAVIAAIEAVLDQHVDQRREVSFPTDAMALRIRQRIRRLIQDEQAETAALAVPQA